MKVISRTEKGYKSGKHKNEDSFLIINGAGKNLPENQSLFVVCDGLGGMKAGDIASKLCCDELGKPLEHTDKYTDKTILINKMLENANLQIYTRQAENKNLSGMATTAVLLMLCENMAYINSVGDSRLYLLRNGIISQITEDETIVWDLFKSGKITKDQLVNHPQSHLLTNAVGSSKDISLRPVITFAFESGDIFLLCSDGLHDHITDKVIEAILNENVTLDEISEKLISAARESKSDDDITIVLVSID